MKPNLPENTINLELKISSRQIDQPDLDLDSMNEFPDLISSQPKQQANTRPLPTAGFKKSSKSANYENAKLNKEQHNCNNNKPSAQNIRQNQDIGGSEQQKELRVFKYKQGEMILNFEFKSDKRVKCSICRNEFKNILHHMQRSKCRISGADDFCEKFKEFTKDDARKQAAIKRAKQ